MDVRRALFRIIHRADTNKAHRGAGLRIITPDRNLADRTARDALALAARGRRQNHLRLRREVLDAIGLVDCVQRMRGTGLALAPGAVAGVDDERPAVQAIANIAAGATAFHVPSSVFPGAHIAEQETGDLALLDLLAAFGDAVAAMVT